MARGIRKTLADYQALAKSRGLEYGEEAAPTSVLSPCRWRCLYCGRRLWKSFHKLTYQSNACRCQAAVALKEADYDRLAESLGIVWDPVPGEYFPQHNQIPTRWRLPGGTHFNASYHRLAWNQNRRIRELLDAAT